MRFQDSLVIKNARIRTLDPARPFARSISIHNGLITSLDRDPLGLDGVRVLDAGGATITPGFFDTHTHFTTAGMAMLAINLEGCKTISEVLERLSNDATGKPTDYLVFATQFAPELLIENRFPTTDELDLAVGNRPVYLMERTGHWSGINQAGLELLDVSPDLPGRQLDEDGHFTGVILGPTNSVAGEKLWPAFVQRVGIEKAIQRAAQEAIEGGITTLHALEELPEVRAILAHRDEIPLRVIPFSQTKDVASVRSLGLRQIGGCGSVIVDGDFGPHTAALLEPYADLPDTRGTLYWKTDELENYVRQAHDAGLQIALHCVGSGAIEQLLNAYEKALAASPRPDHRHRIEHFELPAPGQVERARKLGVALSIQPAFNHLWPHDDEEYSRVVGAQRALQVDPVRRLVEAGLQIALGSDAPVTPLRPLLGIHSAVNHSNPLERIPAEMALQLTTINGAWLSFEEHKKGTLAPGKLGDLVILDDDPLAVAPEKTKDISVLKTVVGGEIVFER